MRAEDFLLEQDVRGVVVSWGDLHHKSDYRMVGLARMRSALTE